MKVTTLENISYGIFVNSIKRTLGTLSPKMLTIPGPRTMTPTYWMLRMKSFAHLDILFRHNELDHLDPRAFRSSYNGRIALLPSRNEEVAHVCVSHGMQLPFLLRKIKRRSRRVDRPCYVHR